MSEVVRALEAKTLVFTVTSGRSGTGLLTRLLRDCVHIDADHEPAPRVNFVLRSLLECPEAASGWLLTEKLPAMLQRANGPIYAETSHLICKGLIEPMLDLGLRPKFIILRRRAREVALSLFQMDVIPGRTGAGKLVLLNPQDHGVLRMSRWQSCTDYQLCYWYILEIERRQEMYSTLFRSKNISFFDATLPDLSEWNTFCRLSDFILNSANHQLDREIFEQVISVNQNTKQNAGSKYPPRDIPADLEQQEAEVLSLVSR